MNDKQQMMATEEPQAVQRHLDDIAYRVIYSYEKKLVNLIRNPDKRKEWYIPAVYGLNEETIYCYYDDTYDMRDILPSVMSRAFCEFAAMANEYGFDRDEVYDIGEVGEDWINSMSSDYSVGMERGVFFQRIAEGLESIGCNDDAESVRKVAQEWLDWQKTAEAPTEYSDFERAYMAAEEGNAECQLWIGRLYLEGEEIYESQLLGSIWIALSATNGSEEGKKWCAENGIDRPGLYVIEMFRKYSDFS